MASRRILGILACSLSSFLSVAALAAPPPMTMSIDADNPSFAGGSAPQDDSVFGFLSGINKSSGMLGNMWGLRPWLGQYGVTFGLQETSEVLGNVSGGTRQGFDYDGLTQMNVQMDTQRAFG